MQRELGLDFAVLPDGGVVEPDPDPGDDKCKQPGDGAEGGIEPRFLVPFFMAG